MKPFLSKFGHLLFQGVASLASVSAAYFDFVPAKYKPLVIAVVTLAQAIVALAHHGKPSN